MKNLIKFGVVAIFSGAMSLQSAEFESNVALSSDYIWRGMTQTAEEPAISGGFDIAGESGLYFGTWASNVEFGDGAALELDWREEVVFLHDLAQRLRIRHSEGCEC